MTRADFGPNTVLLGRYELAREIGRGGCAVVFDARDHKLGRTVAIKLPLGSVLPRSEDEPAMKLSRFIRESRVIAAIQHPNVCAVLDTGVMEDQTPFFVMERLFGESLRSSVTRSSRLGVLEAISVATQLLSGLDAVHAAGVVHRDVKPDNIILVTRHGCDPIVKLLDFGLCRRLNPRSGRRAHEEETMTCEGAVVGTPEYMAPEQIIGSAALDIRVDVYAVGVVLYEMLTGARPFYAPNVRDVLTSVTTKSVPPLRARKPDAPASLEAAVACATHRHPDRRYASAAAFLDALRAVRAELTESQAPRSPAAYGWEPPTTRYRRSSSLREKVAAPSTSRRSTGTEG